jgi:hypothetical protein
MSDYVEAKKNYDREMYLDDKLKSIKPIFKNFIDNNANIKRRER